MTYVASTDGKSIRPVIASKNTDIPFFSPDGKSLLFLNRLQDIDGNTMILQFDISTLGSTELITGKFYSDRPIVSARTNRVYLGNYIIDLSSIPPSYSEFPKTDQIPQNAFVYSSNLSPDENWMVVDYFDHADQSYYALYNLSNMELNLIPYPVQDFFPWSPDSKQIIVFDNNISCFYDVINGKVISQIKQPIDNGALIKWLP